MHVTVIVIGAVLAFLLVWDCRQRSNFYRELYELEEAFEAELDFIHLSKQILEKVLQKTAAFGGILYWFDETQKEFKIKNFLGIPTDRINQVTAVLREPQGILEQAQTATDCYLVRDLSRLDRNGQLGDFCQTVMVIPLANQKTSRGLMVLFRTGGQFKTKVVQIMRFFAPRAAVNLDNARLYQFAKETALENSRLYLNISKLYKQATLDELTGLYNRNFFMQRIKEEVRKAWRLKQPLALVFVDLDFFKKINDQYGHQVGDQLLLEFSNFLKTTIREYDIPCRFGGEEFILLLPHTDLTNAHHLAERLRQKLVDYQFGEPLGKTPVTASFGVNSLTDFPEALAQINDEKVDASIETLINGADEALYRAKESGRNQVQACGAD